jgi:hypothetical protein
VGGGVNFTGEGVARAGEAGFFSKVLTEPLLGSLMMMGLFLAEGMMKCGLGTGELEVRLAVWE